jgi:hypothetical protein
VKFRYLVPLYGFDPATPHVAVPPGAESQLQRMAGELAGTDRLIAIYVPEGTDDVYEVGAMRGRVVGAARLLPMPSGKTIRDYFYEDWEGKRRWPLGWPCEAVYAPSVETCPVLRSLVDMLHGANSFQPYVARLQHGPVELDGKMARELEKRFGALTAL